MKLSKRIPIGAGLGGGSSNAAAALSALNEALGRPLHQSGLEALGLELGADVPFFLRPESLLRCGGVGEIFAPPSPAEAAWSGRRLLLLNPGVHVSTAAVFKNLGLTKGRANTNLGRSSALTPGDNELYEAALNCAPALAEARGLLAETKPDFFGMSGSGATFWAAYADAASEKKAAERLAAARPGWFLSQVEIL